MIDVDALVPVRQLGHGTLCEVLLVELPRGGAAALKQALPHYRGDPDVARVLREEARVHALLQHPRIPRLLAAGEGARGPWLLLEALDGCTLDEVVPKGARAPLDVVACLLEAVLDALGYVHALADDEGAPLHVVHRDIAPHNVVVTRSGDPVLIDFGLALEEQRERWTATGALRGTLGYLAPEAIRGEHVDGRADLFAAAALAFSLLSGAPPFAGKGPRRVLEAVTTGRHRRATELVPSLPAALDGFFARAFAVDARARFSTAAAMWTALCEIFGPLDDERRARARDHLAASARPLLPAPHEGLTSTRTAT